MNKRWYPVEYQSGDENGIKKLYKLSFNQEIDDKQWVWRYINNPNDLVSITLAKTETEIVGQYTVSPVKMKIKDNICIGALSLDTMVHPDFRGQGMFTKLAAHLYETIAKQEMHIIYGFPNGASHHGFVSKLGWTDLSERIPLFIKPLNMKRILSSKINSSFLINFSSYVGKNIIHLVYPTKVNKISSDYTIQQVKFFDKRVDKLWEQASSVFNIITVRDQKYLNWRYVDKPGENYIIYTLEKTNDILGYVVIKIIKRYNLKIGFLVDIFAVHDQPDISKWLVSKAVSHFMEASCDVISCIMFKKGPFAHALKTNGFLFLPSKFHPQEMYLGVRCNTEKYSKEFITNPNNWYITWGDHDDI